MTRPEPVYQEEVTVADWKPGDLCQVKRGKRWVDAEVMTAVPWAFMLAVGDRSVRILELDISTSVRPRPAPRGKLPEPKDDPRPLRFHPRTGGPFPGEPLERVEPSPHADAIRHRPAKRGSPVPILPSDPSHEARVDAKIAERPAPSLRPVPKPTTARSKDYLAHVRTYPCCSCGATEAIHAHHVASGGMGAKASDYLTAPLCGRCHGGWHSKGMLPTPVYLNRAESLATMWEAAARCLEEWITREGE